MVRRPNPKIRLVAIAPGVWEIFTRKIAIDQLSFQFESNQDMQIVRGLIRLDPDQAWGNTIQIAIDLFDGEFFQLRKDFNGFGKAPLPKRMRPTDHVFP